MAGRLRAAAASLYALGWETRRRGYALGWLRPRRIAARVVSIGNLTVGGTGKTTLVLHLAREARAAGRAAAVVCRDYRPGPAGRGDESLMLGQALGAECIYSGRRKLELAVRAAREGRDLVLVDDGFSHWGLERDLDIVLVDARDPWGGGRLLPAGRLREPRRALQRAQVVVVTRLAPGESPAPHFDAVKSYAPAAWLAAGRHRVAGVRTLGGDAVAAGGRARVVTATGSPGAVAASAGEAGYHPVTVSAYRDHHWFTAGEARRELEAARRADAVLLLTAKDAVRWPASAADPTVAVLEAAWEWVAGGSAVRALMLGVPPPPAAKEGGDRWA